MQTETKKLPARVLKLALVILNRFREQEVAYQAEEEEYRSQGFRPHYCRHGVDMWVDWDCACWMCEEYGSNWSFRTAARFALDEAIKAHDEMEKRIQMLIDLHKMGAPIQIAELGAWATEPVERYKNL